jgi:hypothetical protein
MSPKVRIDRAGVVTDDVLELVHPAIDRLRDRFTGRVVNGAGVLSDPSQARAALSAAIRDLTKAAALLDGAEWPAPADYDAL